MTQGIREELPREIGRIVSESPSTSRIERRGGRALRRGRTLVLAVTDVAALAVAYAVTYAVAELAAPPAIVAPAWFLVLLAGIAVPLWVGLLTAYGLYENDGRRIAVASADEVGGVFHAILSGSLVLLLLAQILKRLEGWLLVSALEAALFLAAAIVLVPITRGLVRSWLLPRVMRPRRVLIVGTGPEARMVQRKLADPQLGHEVVGFLADEPDAAAPASCGPIVGCAEDIARVVDDRDVDRVVVASSIASHDEMLALLRTVRRPDVHVSIVPAYHEIFTSNARFDDVAGVPLVSLAPTNLSRGSQVLKRSLDIAVSAAALVVLSPLLAVIALTVRLDSRGPAIYRQERRGRGGRVFRIAKFRSMHLDAEARLEALRSRNDVDGPLFKIKQGDPRITRVGNVLRRTSLDELPQLWNVLRGEMSLVGPRPFVLSESDRITGWASRRLDLTPGITGLWQVLGRNDLPFEEMAKLDYIYVTNWSLWWDIKILCQTVPVVLRRKGAY